MTPKLTLPYLGVHGPAVTARPSGTRNFYLQLTHPAGPSVCALKENLAFHSAHLASARG